MSFLGDGNYKAEVFKDGVNAARMAEDYALEQISVSSETNPYSSSLFFLCRKHLNPKSDLRSSPWSDPYR